MPVRILILLLVAAAANGCAQREVLLPKSATVPPGLDLSGTWQLVEDGRGRVRFGGARDGLIHIFLETGARLKITQTRDGLFISFDRAIVEEYRYGERRVINVGPVEADRVSGWENSSYVIETLGPENNKLVEKYSLADGSRALQREIELYRRGELSNSISQRFERR